MNKLPALALLLDSSRGIYIPQAFSEHHQFLRDGEGWKGVSLEDLEILANPDHEHYWEVWSDVIDKAKWEQDDHVWTLYQDGDLWAMCLELMSDEEKHNMGFDDET